MELASAGVPAAPGSAQLLDEGSPHLAALPGESPLSKRQEWASLVTSRTECQLRERRGRRRGTREEERAGRSRQWGIKREGS